MKPTLCAHKCLVPYEFEMGKRTLSNDGDTHYDWSSNVINAHRIRVLTYYCVDCASFITVESNTPDEEEL